jgi:hypothetical protein
MMLKRYLLVAGFAVTIASTAVYAAGNYSAYPIVGGSSFCLSTVGVNGQQGNTGQGGGSAGVAGSYCAQTVPAGPTILTGTELIPADTGLAGGAPPQTVVITPASLNALPPQFTVGSAAGAQTITLGNLVGSLIITGTGALSSTTVVLPPNPIDGQQLAVSANQTIATFSLSAPVGFSQDAKAQPTALTPSTTGSYGYRIIYHAANTTWYRLM